MSDADVRSRKRKLSELSEHEPSPRHSPSLPQSRKHSIPPPLNISSQEGPAQVDLKPEPGNKEPSHPGPPPDTSVQQAESQPLSPKRSATHGPRPPSLATPVSTRSQPQSQSWVQSWLEVSADSEFPDNPASLPPLSPPPASDPSPEAASLENAADNSPLLRLTARNLRIHDSGAMASSHGSKNTDLSSHQPHNLTRLHTQLLIAHMRVHKRTDRDEFQSTIEKCKALVIDDSKAPVMSDTSAKKALVHRDQFLDDEPSFLVNFLHGAVIKLDQKALVQSFEGQVDTTWENGGIFGICDRLFITNCMANLSEKSKDKLTTDPKIVLTTPKPDLSYGFSIDSFSVDEAEIIGQYADLFCVCPKLASTFFILECKAYSQSIENAEVQVSRGAAALLCAQRQLDILTGALQDEDGVDQRSRVFSMTISPQVARLNVNWIVNSNGTLWYYLHQVRIYQLGDLDEIKQLRRDIWSVIDWGLEFHRPKILKTIEALKGKNKDAIWPRQKASSPSKKRRTSNGD